jgi:hypothetical protein
MNYKINSRNRGVSAFWRHPVRADNPDRMIHAIVFGMLSVIKEAPGDWIKRKV